MPSPRLDRVAVHGTAGSGKTTVAAEAARRLRAPHVELDALRHQPGWVELPDDEFRSQVQAVAVGDRWVVDGNYGVVRDLVHERATAIVWLDLPRHQVMRQVIWRSVYRAITRKELWNGNRERMRWWLRADHPMRWAWSTHARRRHEYTERSAGDDRWIRLRSRREVDAWLASLAQ